ncbi:HWE histidine kinase domain-containing protein [Phenylobacterium sp.]|uniref:sensor histidine kinase n=1 Tax=Phenylobacterium sp. TaxID=1871053 RepID=UPI0025FE8A08|nr:HWE histidine kinase domain-containing protein [Phenylobacterium sp.]
MAGVLELRGDDFAYVMANRNLAGVFGLTPADIAGKTGRELGLSEADLHEGMQILRATLASGEISHVEHPRTIAGERAWFYVTMAPVAGRQRISFASVDITARKAAELEAERQRTRLAMALEATALGLWEYNLKTLDAEWDDRTLSFFGLSPGEKPSFKLYRQRLHPDDRDRTIKAYDEAIDGANGGRFLIEHRIVGADGAVRWLRNTGRVVFDDDVAIRMLGTALDITPEVEAQDRQKLLMAELNHRVKNNLATVQSIAVQTARRSRDMDDFLDKFEGRLGALARTHDVLTQNAWTQAGLGALIRRELASFADRVRISGPPVELPAPQALALGLITHELATNAAKYGAFRGEGAVSVTWTEPEPGVVRLVWEEAGAGATEPGETEGFGMKLIRRLTAGDLRGSHKVEYLASGLRVEIVFPVERATGPLSP